MKSRKLVLPFAIYTCLVYVNATAQADTAFAYKDSAKGQRYCEMVIVKGSLTNLAVNIYNTFGYNACPEDQLKALNTEKIKKDNSAHAAVANGPRYFLMDKIGIYNNDTIVVSFDSIQMRKWAELHVGIGKALSMRKNEPYKERDLKVKSAKFFNKGDTVFEVTSPEHTYIMESYSQEVDTTLTMADLPNLGQRLKLPDGWQYKAVVLDNDLELITADDTESYGLEDEFYNRYQRLN
jgi:hypothetical protein